MPIEIRELVIRAVVTEGPSETEKLRRTLATMKQEILDECRQRLLDQMRRGNDR